MFIYSLCFLVTPLGPGIKKNFNMSANKNYVANRDVVQTVLYALGLEKGQYMTGRVLYEIFDNAGNNLSRDIFQLFILLVASLFYSC